MKWCIILIAGLQTIAAIAQPVDVQFDHLAHVKGLGSRSITSILQDDQGFLWFGTQDGLLRYDGYEVKAYKSNLKDKHSLAENNVRALAKDKQGNIWIATQGGGVDKLDISTGKFIHFRNNPSDPNSISSNVVWSIMVDASNRVWLGTWANGLNSIDIAKSRVQRYATEITDPILALAEDKRGAIWFGAKHLHQLNNTDGSINTIFLGDEFKNQVAGLRAIIPDVDGKIWVASDVNGIYQVDPVTNEITGVDLGLDAAQQKIYALLSRPDGSMWAGSNGGVIIIKDDDRFVLQHNAADPFSLSNNSVRVIVADRSGSVWIGNEGGGINRPLAKKNFLTYRHSDDDPYSLTHNVIRGLYDDKEGRIWIGTQGGGVTIWDPVEKKFHAADGTKYGLKLAGKEVSAFLQDGDSFWIGTWGAGLNQVNLTTRKVVTYRHVNGDSYSLPDDRIQVIHKDRFGVTWIGTENGLSQWNAEQQRFIPFGTQGSVKLLGGNIQGEAFAEEDDGTLWIGSWFGLHRLSADRKAVTYFTSDTSKVNALSSDHVISLHLDKKGNVWIGTFGGGLNQLEISTGKIWHYTEQEGLPNNAVFGIQEDNQGNLWLSTNNGLSRFNPAMKVFRNYDITEGLQSNEFYWGASHKNRDGSMMFGGVNGLNWFRPEDIKDNELIPPVMITDFQIFNRSVAVGKDSPLLKLINFTDAITLNYDQAVLNFQFAALNFDFPEKNQYAYRLENFEDEWNQVGNRRIATYTNLDPGNYILRVKASNNDYKWNEEGIALHITIKPPFWRTWWFYSLIVVVAVTAGYHLIKFRERKLQRDKRQLKESLEASLKQMQDEADAQRKLVMEEQERNKERIWTDQSLAKFGSIMTKDHNSLNELCSSILSPLVKHVGATGGAIFVYDDKLDVLRGTAKFGLVSGKENFAPGDGLVGTCFETGEVTIIDKLPASFIKISSGLGESSPTFLLLMPLKHEKMCMGVIELASFQPIPPYQQQFIMQLMERLAASINTTLLAQRTQQLLKESKIQAEELRMREEELKQNLEEMQAMHEDRDRKTRALENELAELKKRLSAKDYV